MPTNKPIPTPTTEYERQYWQRVANGDVCIAHCLACDHVYHPPRRYCPDCYSDEWEFKSIAGTGTVYGYTSIHRPTQRFASDAPIVSAIITLDEGPRLMGRVACESEAIAAGRRVRLDTSKLSSDNVRLTFKLLPK